MYVGSDYNIANTRDKVNYLIPFTSFTLTQFLSITKKVVAVVTYDHLVPCLPTL